MKGSLTKLLLAAAIGPVTGGSVLAGDLEPAGPPAPTMVTLQEIHDLIQGHVLAKTGQSSCWDDSGNVVGCAGTGQDGYYQAGVEVNPRFKDNGNGTVKDDLTGLIWLKNSNCFGQIPWSNALSSSNALASGACGLTDGSVAGDWRLPNIWELFSLVDHQNNFPALPNGYPFSNMQFTGYWSSTSNSLTPVDAWVVFFNNGVLSENEKTGNRYVLPVRGGQ